MTQLWLTTSFQFSHNIRLRAMLMTMSLFTLCLIIHCTLFVNASLYGKESPYLVPGNCKGKWRPSRLEGYCAGLTPHNHFPQLNNITIVKSSTDCKSICCNMGSGCTTWQFEEYSKICRIGGKTRLGNEKTSDKLPWCDPNPPAKWIGRRIELRNGDKCIWQSDNIDTQCFGMGRERLSSKRGRMDAEQCEQACCNDPKCLIWQANSNGCFYSTDRDTYYRNCFDPVIYSGQRKCLPDYCDGKEHFLGE